jgi:hypothetical protein
VLQNLKSTKNQTELFSNKSNKQNRNQKYRKRKKKEEEKI